MLKINISSGALIKEQRLCFSLNRLDNLGNQIESAVESSFGSNLQNSETVINNLNRSLEGMENQIDGGVKQLTGNLEPGLNQLDSLYGGLAARTMTALNEIDPNQMSLETRFKQSSAGARFSCVLPEGIESCTVEQLCVGGPGNCFSEIQTIPVFLADYTPVNFICLPSCQAVKVTTDGPAGPKTSVTPAPSAIPASAEKITPNAAPAPAASLAVNERQIEEIKHLVTELIKLVPQILQQLGIKPSAAEGTKPSTGETKPEQDSASDSNEKGTSESDESAGASAEDLEEEDIKQIEDFIKAANTRDTDKILGEWRDVLNHYKTDVKDSFKEREDAYKKAIREALEKAGFKVVELDLDAGKLGAYYKKGNAEPIKIEEKCKFDIPEDAPDTDTEKISNEDLIENLNKLSFDNFRDGYVTIDDPKGKYGENYVIQIEIPGLNPTLEIMPSVNGIIKLKIPDELKNQADTKFKFIVAVPYVWGGYKHQIGDPREITVKPKTDADSGSDNESKTEGSVGISSETAREGRNIELMEGFNLDVKDYQLGTVVLTMPNGKRYGDDYYIKVKCDKATENLPLVRVNENKTILYIPSSLRGSTRATFKLIDAKRTPWGNPIAYWNAAGTETTNIRVIPREEEKNIKDKLKQIVNDLKEEIAPATAEIMGAQELKFVYKKKERPCVSLIGTEAEIKDAILKDAITFVRDVDLGETRNEAKTNIKEEKKKTTADKNSQRSEYRPGETDGALQGIIPNPTASSAEVMSALQGAVSSRPSEVLEKEINTAGVQIEEYDDVIRTLREKMGNSVDLTDDIKKAIKESFINKDKSDQIVLRDGKIMVFNLNEQLECVARSKDNTHKKWIRGVYDQLKLQNFPLNTDIDVNLGFSDAAGNIIGKGKYKLLPDGRIEHTPAAGGKVLYFDPLLPQTNFCNQAEWTEANSKRLKFEKAIKETFPDCPIDKLRGAVTPETFYNYLRTRNADYGEISIGFGGALVITGAAVMPNNPLANGPNPFSVYTGVAKWIGWFYNRPAEFVGLSVSTSIYDNFDDVLKAGDPAKIVDALKSIPKDNYENRLTTILRVYNNELKKLIPKLSN